MGSFRSKLSTDCRNANDCHAIEMTEIDVSLDGLPDLAFEQILSRLTLADRLRCRAVSRGWRRRFQLIKVKSFCFSGVPSGLIYGKTRLLSGAFAENFVSSSRFASFFDAYGQTILFSLKHLRLCNLQLNLRNGKAFASALNSLDQLEQLDIIRLCYSQDDRRWDSNTGRYLEPKWDAVIELHLPMLEAIHLECLQGIERLTLDARRLKTLKLRECFALKLRIVHGESVERLLDHHHYCGDWKFIVQNELKNLKYLYVKQQQNFCPYEDLLSNLKQLKEIHVHRGGKDSIKKLFVQKQAHGRGDLKIYFHGLLLNGPNDPKINVLDRFGTKSISHLIESPSRLADEIPFRNSFRYVEAFEYDPMIEALARFTDLHKVRLDRAVLDVERFLEFLQNFDNLVVLKVCCVQTQSLFDQLPDHRAIQKLEIHNELLGLSLDFLLRLKHLICFTVEDSIDAEWIFKAFEELPFLTTFGFSPKKPVRIKKYCPKLFKVSTCVGKTIATKSVDVPDLNAAIRFIMQNTPWKGQRRIVEDSS